MSREIDVMHLGRDRVICAYEVDGLIVDPGPTTGLETLLEGLGGAEPRGLLLTHIHLDHAGASGRLVQRFPELTVYVHERGAPHLLDPERLVKSARQLYGDDMDRLWGEVVAVPEANVRTLSGGETIEGGMRVEYTPGHASHHVSYLHEATGEAFVGDVAGVRIPPVDHVLPLGAGLLLSAVTGAAAWLLGADFLAGGYVELDVPVLGVVKATSALSFDIGVFLVVVGLVLLVLQTLGAEAEQ